METVGRSARRYAVVEAPPIPTHAATRWEAWRDKVAGDRTVRSGLRGMRGRRLLPLCLVPLLSGAAPTTADTTVSFAQRSWRVEAEASNPRTTVTVRHGMMTVNAVKGVTILLLQRLSGSYCIHYRREVLPASGSVYRVSDLNQFWLIDPAPLKVPAVRDGRLESYTPDRLFYVGIGGNSNTTTRFRHYDGSAARPLLAESDLRLAAHVRYDLRTCVLPDRTELYVDGKLLFSAAQTPPPFSYFALRTVGSQQVISDFRIERLGAMR